MKGNSTSSGVFTESLRAVRADKMRRKELTPEHSVESLAAIRLERIGPTLQGH